jgi:hypothetical protein
MSQLENGADILDLEKQLEYTIEKNKQEAAQQSERMMQVQAEENAKTEQMKVQGQMAINEQQNQGKMKEEMVRNAGKDSLLTKEYNMRFLEQLKASADAEAGLEVTNTSRK